MQLVKGTSKDFDKIYSLYKKAFPKKERKPKFLLKRTLKQNKYDLYLLNDNNKTVGFILSVPVKDSDVVMLDYLAINPETRSNGYGTYLLGEVVKQYEGKKVFLCAELEDENATNYEQRVKRLNFYNRNGWKKTGLVTHGSSGEMHVLAFSPIESEDYILAQTYALGNLLMRLGKLTVSYEESFNEFI